MEQERFSQAINCSDAVSITVGRPDFSISSLGVTPTEILPNGNITFSAVVRNNGAIGSNATLTYLRSTNNTIDSSDTELASSDIALLSSGSTTSKITTLQGHSLGTMYYGVCINAVGETITNNNCSDAVSITAGRPDFSISSLGVTPTEILPSGNITFSAVVRNNGAIGSNATLTYLRSTNNTIDSSDTELATDSIASLSVGSTSSQTKVVVGHSLGTMYYGVCVQAALGESSTDNNCSNSIRVEAATTDINLASFSVQSNPVGNAPFTATATVLNNGNRTEKFNINFYRSSDTVISNLDDTLVATADEISLTAGATIDISKTLREHTTTTYYGACIQSAIDIDNTNNCFVSNKIKVFTFINTDNTTDNVTFNLDNPRSIATTQISDKTFLFLSGYEDDGVSSFSISIDGTLTNIDNIGDATNYELDGAASLTTTQISDKTFLFVAGRIDDGLSVFDVSSDGTLTNVDNIDDIDDIDYNLNGAASVTTAQISDKTFLFVAGASDSGISVFDIASDGALTHLYSVNNNSILNLDAAISVTTAQIGSKTFLFVTGFYDGISVFEVASSGTLTNIDNVDSALYGTIAATTAQIGNKTFLFVADLLEHGVRVFDVSSDGNLTNVDNISDNSELELYRAASVTTAQIGSKYYLFVAGREDNGFSIFEIARDGTLTNINNTDDSDNINYELEKLRFVTTTQIGNYNYLLAAGRDDNGFSVFQMAGADNSTVAKAKEIRLGQSYSDNIAAVSSGFDNQYYRIYLFAGSYTISTHSSLDTYCQLYSSSDTNNSVANDDDDGIGQNCSITYSVTAGYYYIRVRGYYSSSTGNFTLNIRRNP